MLNQVQHDIFDNFMNKKLQTYLIVTGLLATMFCLCIGSMWKDSATYDEIPHIAGGYSYLTQQDYRINPEHPPLIKDLEALPLLFLSPKFPIESSDWKNSVNKQWEIGGKILYEGGADVNKILFWGRFPIVLLALLLGFYIFKWVSEIYGSCAGLISLTLYTLSPIMISHSRFITIDMGITALSFIALYYLWKMLENPNWKTFLVATLTFTLTQLGKFTGLVLGPVFIAVVVLKILKKDKSSVILNTSEGSRGNHNKIPLAPFSKGGNPFGGILRKLRMTRAKYIALLLSLFIVSFILIGAVYQWHIAKMPIEAQHTLIDDSIGDKFGLRDTFHKMTDMPVLRPYAQYALGVSMVFVHAAVGHSTYFMGENGKHWWNYFFVGYGIKELIAWQILLYISILFFSWKMVRFCCHPDTFFEYFRHYITQNYIYIGAFIFVLIYLLLGAIAQLQLGIRYILPIFPFLYFFSGVQIAELLQTIKKQSQNYYKIAVGVCIVLLTWGAGATVYTFPSYLSYYNEFIGGSKNGYKYMVDSNTDWGQDLRRLAEFVEENNIDHIKVNYFGGGRPEYYLGDKYEAFWASKQPRKGWIAISASWIGWQKNNPAPDNYEWLANYKPVEFIGNSIFVYHIK